MGAGEAELDMVRRHVREGTEHVATQRALVARLGTKGLPTDEAESLLHTFEATQRQHEEHLARLAANKPVAK